MQCKVLFVIEIIYLVMNVHSQLFCFKFVNIYNFLNALYNVKLLFIFSENTWLELWQIENISDLKIQNSFTWFQNFQRKILLNNNKFKLSLYFLFWFRLETWKYFFCFFIQHLELQNLIANGVNRISHFMGNSGIYKRE